MNDPDRVVGMFSTGKKCSRFTSASVACDYKFTKLFSHVFETDCSLLLCESPFLLKKNIMEVMICVFYNYNRSQQRMGFGQENDNGDHINLNAYSTFE